jgi:hypothetical protein
MTGSSGGAPQTCPRGFVQRGPGIPEHLPEAALGRPTFTLERAGVGIMKRSSIVSAVVAAALLASACNSSSSTQAPAPTSGPTPAPTTATVPPPPTSFTATVANGSMPCPSASSDSCKRTDLTWQYGSANVTGFRIYVASIAGLDPNANCTGAVQDAGLAIAVGSSARTASYYWPISTGVAYCYWITAVSDAGESAKVPAAGQV